MSDIPPTTPQPQSFVVPHRGVLILVLGIISLTVCAPLGLAAWVMGNGDLKKMKAGVMDAEGKGLTTGGMICGIISSALLVLGVVFYVVILAVFAMSAAAGAAGGP
ncbi:MAG: DUF4190 domain-containing protein [Planctomycetota bacterium]|nr:DUF4190 domain-containing protein [Planctomycetota bacterium]